MAQPQSTTRWHDFPGSLGFNWDIAVPANGQTLIMRMGTKCVPGKTTVVSDYEYQMSLLSMNGGRGGTVPAGVTATQHSSFDFPPQTVTLQAGAHT